jgi:hypothetical protein
LAQRTDRVLALEHGKLSPSAEAFAGAAGHAARPANAGVRTPGERG